MNATWSNGSQDILADLRAIREQVFRNTSYQPLQFEPVSPENMLCLEKIAAMRGMTVYELACVMYGERVAKAIGIFDED